jgi:phage baseplate assembly protein W
MSAVPVHPALGRDLRVVQGPPGVGAFDAAALDVAERVNPSQQASPRRAARVAVPPDPTAAAPQQGWGPEPPGAAEVTDLAVIEDRENVAQALILRLLTPVGSLAELGHAEYGSRLVELIGQRKSDSLRGLCRAFILEAVRLEPRVQDKPLAITFQPDQETSATFVVEVAVVPVSGGDPVSVGMEIDL